MTLRELFGLIGENPTLILFYFSLLPTIALLANFMGKGEGNIAPWKHLYSVIIFLVSIPGIFAVTLNMYLFLFEKRSIFDTDIYTQILPIVSMVFTLYTIRQNADFEHIPGFNKLSAMISMIVCTLIFMWIIDRTHFIVFTNMPFQYALGLFFILFVIIRMSWSKIFSK
jgi:hypothetical protein